MAGRRKNPMAVALGRRGGKARLKTMTADERKESARAAARARWKAYHQEQRLNEGKGK